MYESFIKLKNFENQLDKIRFTMNESRYIYKSCKLIANIIKIKAYIIVCL